MFENCEELTNTQELFKDCKNLGYMKNTVLDEGISYQLFKDCKKLQNTKSMFHNCYNLNIPLEYNEERGLFTDCSQLQNTSSMFRNCYYLKGKIPANMFSGMTENSEQIYEHLTNISYMFSGCGALTVKFDGNENLGGGYVEGKIKYLVPSNWLSKCPKIKDASYLFNSIGTLLNNPSDIILQDNKNTTASET